MSINRHRGFNLYNMITIICALDENRAIGFEGHMLFHLRGDLQRFKTLTSGHTVIMGRKTFESLPKGALPNRRNFVISGSLEHAPEGTHLFSSLESAIQAAAQYDREVFVIGGESIYKAALPLADRLCLTYIEATAPEADTFFPKVDYNEWRCTFSESHTTDEHNEQPYTFADYVRIQTDD